KSYGKRTMQVRKIGLYASKESERFDGLVNAHPAAVEHAGAFCDRSFDELGFDRSIDDVGSPMRSSKRGHRDRVAWKAAHADLRGVDDPVGARDVAREIIRDAAA